MRRARVRAADLCELESSVDERAPLDERKREHGTSTLKHD